MLPFVSLLATTTAATYQPPACEDESWVYLSCSQCDFCDQHGDLICIELEILIGPGGPSRDKTGEGGDGKDFENGLDIEVGIGIGVISERILHNPHWKSQSVPITPIVS